MTDWENYDSGPFCRHYHDPSDCDLTCAKCGHRCPDHDYTDGTCMECDCPQWEERESQ